MVVIPYSVRVKTCSVKPVHWVGSTKDDLRAFPREVRREMGFALHAAQRGERHSSAKALKGFGGAGVLEIVENHRGDTYRGVYTVRFAEAVYVLHCFKKKSKRGIETPQLERELIKRRLARAKEDYERWLTERQA